MTFIIYVYELAMVKLFKAELSSSYLNRLRALIPETVVMWQICD